MRLDKYLNRKYEKTLYFFGEDEDGDSKFVEYGNPMTEQMKIDMMKMPVFSLGELGAARHNSLREEREKEELEELYLPFDKWIIHYIDYQNNLDCDYFMMVILDPKKGQVRMKRIHFRKDAPQYIFSDYYWLSANTLARGWHKKFRRLRKISDENSLDYLDYTELDLDERFMINHLMNVTWLLSIKKIEENLKEIKANPSLVKVAQKKGKLPPISYKVLDLNLYKRKSKKGGFKFPNRQKPGQHTRRGHQRTYQSGKKIYIKPQVINLGSERKIYKDYRIKGGEKNV